MTSEKPQGYIPRIVDSQIQQYLRIFGAVEVAGTKWCGKTWSSLAHAKSVSYVDDNLDLAKADPSMMLLGEKPHAIDEWQLVPSLWDSVRREVDKPGSGKGAFILTGSSTPHTRTASGTMPAHSGAGRIGRIRMHPMSLYESGDSNGIVSLANLFDGSFEPGIAEKDTMALVGTACRGGWPAAIDIPPADAQIIAREYLHAAIETNIRQLGLDPDIARRTATSLARNVGQAATYKTIISDMFGAEDNPSAIMDEGKVRLYIDALKSMYLIEEVPGWAPPARDKKRFATKPKRYFADPSLAVAALGMSPQALLDDWQTFGLIFENMVIRDLMVYARALNLADSCPVRYYRDDSGLEADAIIQLADGKWAAFEIKASEDKVANGIARLSRLKAKVTKNPKSRTEPPAFMAVITGVGEYARQEGDGIYVIPIRALRA